MVVEDNVQAASEGVVKQVSNKVTWEMTSFATRCRYLEVSKWFNQQVGFTFLKTKHKSHLRLEGKSCEMIIQASKSGGKIKTYPNLLRQTVGSVIKSGVGAA